MTTVLRFGSVLELIHAVKLARRARIGSTPKVSRDGYSVIFHASPILLEREIFVASV